MNARQRQRQAVAFLTAPAYLWLALTVFLPLAAMLYFSFLTVAPIGNRVPEFTLANYTDFFTKEIYWYNAWRSFELGLYVTGMMGFGFNAVTGDFSRGAVGYWIEDGELAFPVSEVTISLNFQQLFGSIDAVANDLDLKSGVASPTFRVARMTIAGS